MDHSETDSPAEVAASTPTTDGPPSAVADAQPSSATADAGQGAPADHDQPAEEGSAPGGGTSSAARRRRGSRGGQRRRGAGQSGETPGADDDAQSSDNDDPDTDRNDVELPEPMSEGRASAEAAEKALVRKPRIGDTMPIPTSPPPGPAQASGDAGTGSGAKEGGDRQGGDKQGGDKRRRRRSGGSGESTRDGNSSPAKTSARKDQGGSDSGSKKSRRSRGRGKAGADDGELNEAMLEQRRGRERNGKPIGRYFMAVQVRPGMAQVGVLEGRNLIEHYVSRPADDVSQIHGNIYVGRVQNVLPGMEAAFVDIATPKNAVLYRGDVQYDAEDIDERGKNPRIEDILKNKQLIICQVTKNPIAHKGARLTQEVSLPGRFVVLIPNSKTYGISKRLPDDVRKRLRGILDRVKPDEHGLIVRTAAETATEQELVADMTILLQQWEEIAEKAAKTQRPTLLYREPELAVRVIREEFNADYRGVVIDDERLHREVQRYVAAFNPELADRIEYYDATAEGLSIFERHHIHEQVHKALDRKVWLPSGGSLIIEHTEALTVIDVNTGKNVGKSNLEDTVFVNNMEAAVEIAKQLRLRDIGGIIVIDFIDMEIKGNRAKVVEIFRDALARDKTRSQVFDITELGLVEMTRKRIGEGLLTEYSEICPDCEGRGVLVDYSLLE
jgi:ribonuclease E